VVKIKTKIFYLLAPFLLGLSLGASGLNAYTGHYIDELLFRLKNLEEQLAGNQSEIEQLKLNLIDKTHPVLSAINVYATVIDDNLTKLEQEQVKIETIKDVKQRLVTMLGQELSKINFLQLALILDGREITADKIIFTQKVNLLIVKENVLNIYITCQPQKKKSNTLGYLAK
jgi:hypothetical protein